MADEGLNPWCDDHWTEVRNDDRLDAIAAPPALVNRAVNHDDFKALMADEHGGSLHDAMEAESPLCCFLQARDDLATVYDTIELDDPVDPEPTRDTA